MHGRVLYNILYKCWAQLILSFVVKSPKIHLTPDPAFYYQMLIYF